MSKLRVGWQVRCFDGETGEMLWDISDVHKGGVTALQVVSRAHEGHHGYMVAFKVSYNQRFMITGGENGD